MIRIPHAARLLAPLAVLALAACAAGGGARTSSSKPEDIVQQRAVERWQFMIDGKFAEAYAYLSPGFRSTRSQDDYVRSMSGRVVKWLAVKPYESHCEESRCTVTVTVEFEAVIPGSLGAKSGAPQQIVETWILSDRRWYLVPEDVAQGGA